MMNKWWSMAFWNPIGFWNPRSGHDPGHHVTTGCSRCLRGQLAEGMGYRLKHGCQIMKWFHCLFMSIENAASRPDLNSKRIFKIFQIVLIGFTRQLDCYTYSRCCTMLVHQKYWEKDTRCIQMRWLSTLETNVTGSQALHPKTEGL